MPATRLGLSLVNAYRARTGQLLQVHAAQVRTAWTRLDPNDLDGSHPAFASAARTLTVAAQAEAVRLSGGYLSAYLTAELDEPTVVEPPQGDYVDAYRDGGPLPLEGSLIAVKVALKRGQPIERALGDGLKRATLTLGQAVDHAATASLMDGIAQDDRFDGWARAVRGTCGACLGAATGIQHGLRFPKHPHCKCVAAPVVKSVPNRFPIPTGAALFAAMTAEEQNAAVGPVVAEAVRGGAVALSDLVGEAKQARGDDYITQAAAT